MKPQKTPFIIKNNAITHDIHTNINLSFRVYNKPFCHPEFISGSQRDSETSSE